MSRHRTGPRNYKDKKTCLQSGGKVCYATRKAALGSSHVVEKLYDVEINIYKCSFCGDMHLTRSKRSGKEARKERSPASTGVKRHTGVADHRAGIPVHEASP